MQPASPALSLDFLTYHLVIISDEYARKWWALLERREQLYALLRLHHLMLPKHTANAWQVRHCRHQVRNAVRIVDALRGNNKPEVLVNGEVMRLFPVEGAAFADTVEYLSGFLCVVPCQSERILIEIREDEAAVMASTTKQCKHQANHATSSTQLQDAVPRALRLLHLVPVVYQPRSQSDRTVPSKSALAFGREWVTLPDMTSDALAVIFTYIKYLSVEQSKAPYHYVCDRVLRTRELFRPGADKIRHFSMLKRVRFYRVVAGEEKSRARFQILRWDLGLSFQASHPRSPGGLSKLDLTESTDNKNA
ncbi:MAG: hypothetical protein L6R39_007204 [Caloplaca ligustica]|nr:MAG: hypothetical protein L6R39_007204 [Caloplaca ligustica]